MIDAARFLGFAFANADFLFEIDGKGTILFAVGAASEFVNDRADAMVGKPSGRLFTPADGTKFSTYARALAQGDRAGPYRLQLVGGKEASVAMFRLPQSGDKISCTFSRTGARPASADKDPKTGLATRESFVAAAAQMAGGDASITLVDVPGLPDAVAKMGPESADKLLQHIGAAVADIGAKAAARLSESSFGIIADAIRGKTDLGGRLRKALKEGGAGELPVEEALISLKGKDLSTDQRMLALRYVVDRFAKGEHAQASNLESAFQSMMDDTLARARALTETVADGAFSMAYQPIAYLESGKVSHFEALTRFAKSVNTQETVEFAERFGISDAFDLAVAMKVVSAAEEAGGSGMHIAFNISGRTISSPASFGLIAGFLARKRSLAPRLLIEITETAEIADLAEANKAVTTLREMGFRVGLDDFGAGAASLQYLHALHVDFVKFDGSLVKKIGQSKRDETLLIGIVKLCKELGVHTVAEYLETAEQVARAREIGFDMGQGHYFGAAGKGPSAAPAPAPAARKLKRRGVQESWG
jgi:EAL domain-containing protein (putative c-di-GMP-specific phosphodiesterase class I)/GGDEF domain-containing protein